MHARDRMQHQVCAGMTQNAIENTGGRSNEKRQEDQAKYNSATEGEKKEKRERQRERGKKAADRETAASGVYAHNQ